MNTVMAATGFLTGYIVPFILVLSLLATTQLTACSLVDTSQEREASYADTHELGIRKGA